MPRKLIITSNGLGMALNHERFSLEYAINHVWNQHGAVPDEQKGIITTCVDREDAAVPPRGEHELDRLHRVVSACELLTNIYPENNPQILTDAGINLPRVLATFIHRVAHHLFEQSRETRLPDEFIRPLLDHVGAEKSHVATLNYDCLLYDPFISEGICDGYNGSLVDGIFRRGFNAENLDRLEGRDFGWYLHLHGSPLFYNDEGVIKKFAIDEIHENGAGLGKHLVLTHVSHKRSVIDQSDILKAYWQRLSVCLEEASEIIIIGYSGGDLHLNQVIKPYLSNTPIRIIEWSGSGEREARVNYWRGIFPSLGADNLVHMDNILEFADW